MITTIRVAGFKRFVDQRFDLRPLTVLTGINGTGKTSLIQAFLVASEASRSAGMGSSVALNGPFGLELGTAESIRNWASDTSVRIEIAEANSCIYEYELEVPSDDALHLNVLKRPLNAPSFFAGTPRSLTYLSAERLGPRSVLGAFAGPPETIHVGSRGEYCAQVLGALGLQPLKVRHRHHETAGVQSAPLLKYEAEHWLSVITRPIELASEWLSGTAVTAMQFRSPGGEWVRAPNMGFGMTYSLPVVLGGLIADEKGLMIVENPEAHLHPSGQSQMGYFLAWLASTGLQVIVETHSDHVLNGVRRAIGERRIVSRDDAVVHYFSGADDRGLSIETLSFTETGGLSGWPRGFFDQYQVDVAALTQVRRSK